MLNTMFVGLQIQNLALPILFTGQEFTISYNDPYVLVYIFDISFHNSFDMF